MVRRKTKRLTLTVAQLERVRRGVPVMVDDTEVRAKPGDSDFWTARDVAVAIGVPERTIRYWARAGTIPACRDMGGRWYFNPLRVQAWKRHRDTLDQ